MKKILQSLFILMFIATSAFAQNRTVTGTVTSEDNQPIPGVSVRIKGSRGGVSTAANGQYTISAGPDAILVFSSVGFLTHEQNIGQTANTFNLMLRADAKSLDEVVVQVPYGTVKKSAFTGSEATVTSASLEKQQVTSFTKALEGLIPGISVTNGGGQPGSNATILIRGVGSVNASSEPLYVVNGAVYNGSISSLAMDDIASVTVLKDAAAAALYGSRAANGVIMVTTKKGRIGKTVINANLKTGLTYRGIPEYDRVNQQQYYELMWEATRNRLQNQSGQTRELAGQNASAQLTGANGLNYNAYNVPGNTLVSPTGVFNPNASLLWDDKWSDVLFQTGNRQDFNFNVSGANEKTDYFFSAGYVGEKGTAKFSDYDRFSTRLNVNTQITDYLKGGAEFDGALADQKTVPTGGTATTNPFYYSRMMGPIYPVYQRDATGGFIIDPATGQNALDYGRATAQGGMALRPYAPNSNLLGTLALDQRGTKSGNINARTYLEATFLKDFAFRTEISSTYYNGYQTTFQNSLFGDADNVAGRSTKRMETRFVYTLNQILKYNKAIGDHNISALAGHENYKFKINILSATRTGFPFPGSSELASAATAEGSTSYEDNHGIESYFANANYDYKGRYLLSGSFRTDGTSRFSANARWGKFYSVGAGWRMSQENFLKDVSWIDELKLKASYGESGNENIVGNYYVDKSLYSLGYNNVNFPGAIINTLANDKAKWEKIATANIGVDFSFFKNRLQGTIEVYDKSSKDLLFQLPIANSTGIPFVDSNVGDLRNRGLDISLSVAAIRKTNFDWRIDVNFSTYKNKITSLPQSELIVGTKKLMVGKSVYDWWLRDFAGVDPNNGDALYYRDVLGANGLPTGERTTTNNISNGSFYYKGTALPDFQGGITNSFRFKDFDLSILTTYSSGGKFYDGNYAGLMHVGSYGTAWSTDILNRWTTPGQITDVPRIQNALATQSGQSSRFLFDASYLNIKNVTLGYTLPKNLTGKIGVNGLKVFANVDNAYLFTKEKGMDPQRAINGVSDYTYPIFRTFTVGLNVKL
jgi:TonB-linked SusC/RagA family outer membrane protein